MFKSVEHFEHSDASDYETVIGCGGGMNIMKKIWNINILKQIQAPMFKSVKHLLSSDPDAGPVYERITGGGEGKGK